jgi:restriction endonuclease Mrr
MSRTTPTSADLMPEVLELLKREKEMKKQSIATYMRNWIKKHHFDDRDRSIGWALNRLEKEGYVAHPRIGIWKITAKGLAYTLTTEESLRIVELWTQRERAAKSAVRLSRG